MKHAKYLLVTGVVPVALGLVVRACAAHALGLNKVLLGVRDLHARHLLQTKLNLKPVLIVVSYCRCADQEELNIAL